MEVEYRVRPVTRYIVTRYEESESGGASEVKGEFPSQVLAYDVAVALMTHEAHSVNGSIEIPPRPTVRVGGVR